ncbi:MAG: AIR synthase-related protein, partial [Polaromonas sp.]
AHGCELVGGDTTQGPLNICITVFGEVPVVDGKSQALLRSGARAGDDLYVSGTLGDARMALEALRGTLILPPALLALARHRLEQPTPRVALGQALRGVATAALDISDGLMGDLRHILKASGVGATLDIATATNLIAAHTHPALETGLIPPEKQLEYVLAGGDDYELAFTAPASAREAVRAASRQAGTPVTRIGRIEAEPGIRLLDASGQPVPNHFSSFDHFAQAQA